MWLVIQKIQKLILGRENDFFRHFRRTLAGFVLSNSRFSNDLKQCVSFAKVFEIEYNYCITKIKAEDTESKFEGSIFFQSNTWVPANGIFVCIKELHDVLLYKSYLKLVLNIVEAFFSWELNRNYMKTSI